MFKNITVILDQFLTKPQKREYLEFLEVQKKWKKNISKEIQKNAAIVDLRQQTVTIKAKTPAWKNEIIFLIGEIKKKFLPKTPQLIKL